MSDEQAGGTVSGPPGRRATREGWPGYQPVEPRRWPAEPSHRPADARRGTSRTPYVYATDPGSVNLTVKPSKTYCPVSAVHTHDEGSRRDGRCTWCGYRFDPPAARPRLDGWRTELDAAYRRHWDPDYGSDPRDL